MKNITIKMPLTNGVNPYGVEFVVPQIVITGPDAAVCASVAMLSGLLPAYDACIRRNPITDDLVIVRANQSEQDSGFLAEFVSVTDAKEPQRIADEHGCTIIQPAKGKPELHHRTQGETRARRCEIRLKCKWAIAAAGYDVSALDCDPSGSRDTGGAA